MEIDITTKKMNGRLWLMVRISGELDMYTADTLRRRLDAALAQAATRHICFDFAGVNFIDSSGLGLLLGRYRQVAPAGGALLITNCTPPVYRLLLASGMDKVLQIDRPRVRADQGRQ
ncbi:MAG: anti-sigma factor antagonist [Bacillota bacterium]|nr:anti-sigma factor antagonist [Bacillota bacterium]